MLMFDTSLLHEAANEAETVRYILMLRVWHPALAQPEVRYTIYKIQLQHIKNTYHDAPCVAPCPRPTRGVRHDAI